MSPSPGRRCSGRDMYMFHTMNILCYLGSGDLLLESLLGYLKECSNLYSLQLFAPRITPAMPYGIAQISVVHVLLKPANIS